MWRCFTSMEQRSTSWIYTSPVFSPSSLPTLESGSSPLGKTTSSMPGELPMGPVSFRYVLSLKPVVHHTYISITSSMPGELPMGLVSLLEVSLFHLKRVGWLVIGPQRWLLVIRIANVHVTIKARGLSWLLLHMHGAGMYFEFDLVYSKYQFMHSLQQCRSRYAYTFSNCNSFFSDEWN